MQGIQSFSGQAIGTSLSVIVFRGASALGNFTIRFVESKGEFDDKATAFFPVASPIGDSSVPAPLSSVGAGHPVNFLLRAQDTNGVFYSQGMCDDT
jgi:hypothetical protein